MAIKLKELIEVSKKLEDKTFFTDGNAGSFDKWISRLKDVDSKMLNVVCEFSNIYDTGEVFVGYSITESYMCGLLDNEYQCKEVPDIEGWFDEMLEQMDNVMDDDGEFVKEFLEKKELFLNEMKKYKNSKVVEYSLEYDANLVLINWD